VQRRPAKPAAPGPSRRWQALTGRESEVAADVAKAPSTRIAPVVHRRERDRASATVQGAKQAGAAKRSQVAILARDAGRT